MATFGPPTPLTRDDFVDLLRRNFPDGYIDELSADPSSQSILEGFIAIALRLQTAVDYNLSTIQFITTAPEASASRSTMTVQRASGAAGTITAGLRAKDQRGILWRVSADVDVPLAATTQTIDVAVETERIGEYLDTLDPPTFTLLDDLFDAGFVVVEGPDPADGGALDYLGQHGSERLTPRIEGETADQYRTRLRILEDVVSPQAMLAVVRATLGAFSVSSPLATWIDTFGYRPVRESFRSPEQTAVDGLDGDCAAFLDDSIYLDDPAAPEIRDLEDALRWFDVFLPTIADPDEPRLFADDGYLDDPEFGYLDDPGTPGLLAAHTDALLAELDRHRALGVRFRIVIGAPIHFARHLSQGDLSSIGDWSDADGNTAEADIQSATERFDGDTDYALCTTGAGTGSAVAPGDLLFEFPALPAFLSVERVVLRCRARQSDVGAGSDANLQFVLAPTTAGAAERVGAVYAPDKALYREFSATFTENPITAAPWTVGDLSGTLLAGVANVGTVGATEELRVSEFLLELVLNYG